MSLLLLVFTIQLFYLVVIFVLIYFNILTCCRRRRSFEHILLNEDDAYTNKPVDVSIVDLKMDSDENEEEEEEEDYRPYSVETPSF